MNANSDNFGGIYVHIPYCVRKCPYCDFYSSVDISSIPVFLESLKREMEMVGGTDQVYDTLYIGGGTPSVLEAEGIAQIIETAHMHFTIHADIKSIDAGPAIFCKALPGYCAGIDFQGCF